MSEPIIPERAFRWKRLRGWLVVVVVSGLLGWYALPWLMPWPPALDRPVPEGVRLTDRHGTPLRRMLAEGQRTAGVLPFADIPPALVEATLAAEDQRFFQHGGVDLLALGRAARDSLGAGRRLSGASTITQQLVKLADPGPRTITKKLREILTARRVEMTWNKERILEQYLARLDYGNLHRGPAAAASGYFGKPLGDCSLAECAFLAGLPQAPSRMNPWRDPAPAVKRQQWILGRREVLGRGDQERIVRARAEPLRLRRHYGTFAAPHFADLLLHRTQRPPADGPWMTALDLNVQQLCERTVADRLNRLREKNVRQAAVVVIHNETGEIRALVGSRDYNDPNGGQVNGATARRSPGSALKPFTYLLALSAELSPASILADLPVEYMTETGLYRPQNYHHRAAGPVSLRSALANSLNLSAVRILEDHGGPAALVASLQAAGLTTLTKPAASYGLGLTIGGGEVTLLELTAAYSTLARMGRTVPARFLPVESGAAAPESQQLYDPDACWLLADVLSDNQARARTFGTDSALRLTFPCAVKTGTSTDYRDNWAMGYNASFTVGVWVGNFDNSPMRGVSGVTGAAPIFRDVMTWLEARYPSPWFPKPVSVVELKVDPLTGLPRPAAVAAQRPVVLEKFRRELLPEAPAAEQYDAAGRVRLPAEYGPWLSGPDNYLGASVVVAPAGPAGVKWRIASPLPGTTVMLDPDLPNGGRSLPLRVNPGVSGVRWTSPTLRVEGTTAWLVPGRHELTARDATTGKEAVTWVEVRAL